MAEIPELTVSVEAAIHDALRDVLERCAKEFGTQVTAIKVGWKEEQIQVLTMTTRTLLTMTTRSKGEQ